MGWFDDLETRIRQEADKAFSDVNDYIRNRAIEPVVRIGQEQLGNLSQQQLDAGKAGAPAPASASAAVAAAGANLKSYAPYILAGIAAYFVFSKKSRG